MAAINGIGWFEIGTADPARAERFYGAMFGWTVAQDDTKSTDPAYRIISTGDPDGLRGGLFATGGEVPDHAVFGVLVDDVEAACERAERAGGKVLRAPKVNSTGVVFAHLLDPGGSHFSVFAPPAGRG